MACPITDNSQRRYPLKQPDGWKPKVPRWTLKLPEHVSELVIAYVGVQNRDTNATVSKDNYSHINSKKAEVKGNIQQSFEDRSTAFVQAVEAIEQWTQESDTRPVIVNRFEVLAGRDIPGAREWVCYWISKANADESLDLLDLKRIRDKCIQIPFNTTADSSSIGLWLEVIYPDLTHFETNYSGDDYRPGIAALDVTFLEPHDLTGYWGAARDRIRASAYDDFKDDSDSHDSKQYQPEENPLHVKGFNTHTIAHIRSGQFWERCNDTEREAYEKSLEPHLLTGLADIFSRPDELGDYGLRFVRNLPPDISSSSDDDYRQNMRRETCAAGFSRSLADLENWAKNCPSHHKIYGGAIHHKQKFGTDARLRTWHEVAVLKPGEAQWEYIGCDKGTGTIGFQGPAVLLPEDLKNLACRVLVYGYDADSTIFGDGTSKDLIHNYAETLASRLVANRSKNATKHPIIFVCHSMSGLIVKRLLIYSKNIQNINLERYRSIYVSTYAILFLGTPHTGSDLATWDLVLQSTCATLLPGETLNPSSRLIQALQTNSETLQNINRLFSQVISRFKVFFFHEGKPTALGGIRQFVVNEHSAAPDVDGAERCVIERDHFSMCRFEDRHSPGYDVLSEAVVRYATEAPVTIQQRWENEERDIGMKRRDIARELLTDFSANKEESRARTVWHVPFDKLPNITGREIYLDSLRENLFQTNDHRIAALFGLGGVGKSRIALEIARYARNLTGKYSVFWVQATNRANFECSYLDIGRKLGVPGLDAQKADKLKLVQDYLNLESTGHWLMILDNADDEALWGRTSSQCQGHKSLASYLPKSSLGSILITTRFHQIAIWLATKSDAIELRQMEADEVINMFKSLILQVDDNFDSHAASKLVEELSFLPLAIVQAAGYMNMTNASIQGYLEVLSSHREKDIVELLSKDCVDDVGSIRVHYSIMSGWLISFESISEKHPSAATYLRYMVCLHEKNIPRSLLPEVSNEDFVDIMSTLFGYSFLQKQEQHYLQDSVYNMHRLVRLATRNWLKNQDLLKSAMSHATDEIFELLTPFTLDFDPELWRLHLPHVEESCNLAGEEDFAERNLLLIVLGMNYHQAGAFHEAIRCFSSAASWFSQDGALSEGASIAQYCLGRILLIKSNHIEGEKQLKKALLGFAKVYGLEHSVTIDTMSSLMIQHRDRGRADEAAAVGTQLLEACRETFGEKHFRTLEVMVVLMGIYDRQNRCHEAKDLAIRILSQHESSLDLEQLEASHHPELIAKAHWYLKQWRQAADLFEHVLQTRSRISLCRIAG